MKGSISSQARHLFRPPPLPAGSPFAEQQRLRLWHRVKSRTWLLASFLLLKNLHWLIPDLRQRRLKWGTDHKLSLRSEELDRGEMPILLHSVATGRTNISYLCCFSSPAVSTFNTFKLVWSPPPDRRSGHPARTGGSTPSKQQPLVARSTILATAKTDHQCCTRIVPVARRGRRILD